MRARFLVILPVLAFAGVFAGTFAYYELRNDEGAAGTINTPGRVALPHGGLFVALEDQRSVRLHRVGLDGISNGPLTAGSEPDDDADVLVEAHPDWSPVAKRLVFTRYLVRGDQAEPPKIWAALGDGSDLVQVTGGPMPDFLPVWSPDGQRIAFTRELHGSAEIFVMNADGSDETQLTHDRAAHEEHPTWSPDGARIAFTSNTENDQDLYVMNADGSDATRLTNGPFEASDPAWSPEGDEIALMCDADLCLVEGEQGSRPVQLIGTPEKEFSPRWSPDGKWIAFARDPGLLMLLEVETKKLVRVPLQGNSFTLSWGPE